MDIFFVKSGLLGSYFLSLCLVPILVKINFINQDKILFMFFCVFLISSISQFGDIVISYFKRLSNVKDTGKILPGHGGLLDRIDGMLFAFPFAYILILNDLFF